MPPFAGPKSASDLFFQSSTESKNEIITINVGGQRFQTSKQTLALAGPKSLLSRLSNDYNTIPFIDRDPELFVIFLSLLRKGKLPSQAKAFDIEDLVFESRFYGIENLLINAQSNPSEFQAFNLERSMTLPLIGRDAPSAIATTANGSVHVAHSSKITSFDWSLQRKSTILTHFTAIDSLLALSSKTVAAGATDFSGLQIIDLDKGSVKETLNWENVTRSGSTVQAIASSPDCLFTSFESSRRNSNCIMVYDIRDGLRPVTEIGHCEIFGAELNSAIPATKLQWVSSHNLLMASGSHSDPSGVLGYVKFWDIRSGNVVSEIHEKVDCFADVTVSDNLSALFKVGVNSGEVFFADLRNFGGEHSWVCLGDNRKSIKGKKEGSGCRIESQGNQIFCSKGGNMEFWSEISMGSSIKEEERVFKKSFMGRAKDMDGSRITHFGFGGNKMFVTRKGQQCVEVWQSSSGKGF